MCVQRNWVRKFSSIEKTLVFMLVSKCQETSPTCIDMMPKSILFTDSWDFMVVIKAPHNCWAGHRVHIEWFVSFCDLIFNLIFQCLNIHSSSPSLTRYLSHLIHSHPTYHCSPCNRIMWLSRSESYRSIFWSPALHSNMWEVFMSCAECRHYIWHTTAWVKSAIYSFRVVSKWFSEKLDAFNFHHGENRRHMVNMCASVKHCYYELSYLTYGVRSAIQFVVEKWMHGFEAVFESCLDGLYALLNTLSFHWNFT